MHNVHNFFQAHVKQKVLSLGLKFATGQKRSDLLDIGTSHRKGQPVYTGFVQGLTFAFHLAPEMQLCALSRRYIEAAHGLARDKNIYYDGRQEWRTHYAKARTKWRPF